MTLLITSDFHEEYSIGFIDQGATNAWCDGKPLRVEAGRMICFPAYMLHACHPDPGVEWRYRMLFIKPDWLQGLKQRDLGRLQIPYLLDEGKNKACRALMEQTMNALTGNAGPLQIETALINLIQAIVHRETSDLEHDDAGCKNPKYIKLIKEYMHAHFTEKITLQDLEQVAGVSRFHLIRMFKKTNHLPPYAYQNLLRINRAKSELLKKRPLADIAAEAGFYDQSHFTRSFSKIVGTTPHKYATIL